MGLTLLTGAHGNICCLARGEPELLWPLSAAWADRHTFSKRTIQLRWETGWIRQTTVVARDLAAPMAALDVGDSSTYSIAWIDCIPKGLAARSCSLANTPLGTSCGAVRRRTSSLARRSKALNAD